MVSRLIYDQEVEILNELDILNEQQEFTRNDADWYNKTIKKLLLELHFIRNEIINKNT